MQKNKPNSLEEFVKNETFEIELFEYENPKSYNWKDIDAMDFPDNRWLVKNILPKEGITIFASVSGEGKSLLMVYLAKCLSEGSYWFGNEKFKTEQARVLYVNLEMSMSEMQRRGRKIGLDPSNENLIFLNEDDMNLNPKDDYDLAYKWLLQFIYKNRIEVLIIDTFRASSGGLREEKAEEVRSFFKKFQILKNSGVSMIFLEHVRKPMQFEGKVPKKEQLLGSQDKTANAEVLLMIRKDENTGHIHVYQRKNRLGTEVNPFSVKMTDVIDDDGTERIEFEYLGEIDDDTSKKEEAKSLVLEILASGERRDRKELHLLTKKQVGEKNLRAALAELVTLKEIEVAREGRKYVYSMPSYLAEPEEYMTADKSKDFFSDE